MRIVPSIIFATMFLLPVIAEAQRHVDGTPTVCPGFSKSKAKYQVLSVSYGKELQFYLALKPNYRSDKHLRSIALEFKTKYCREQDLRVIFFASKKKWMITDLKNPDSTPLAIFYTGKTLTEKEGIVIYKVVNGSVESREILLNG